MPAAVISRGAGHDDVIGLVDKLSITEQDSTNLLQHPQLIRVRTNVVLIDDFSSLVATYQSISEEIIWLGRYQEYRTRKVLEYFRPRIGAIARDALAKSDNAFDALWRTAEECYNQAISTTGKLSPDEYISSLRSLEDPRATSSGPRMRPGDYREDHDKTETRQKWTNFWVEVMERCPGGPTVFHPSASSIPILEEWPFKDIPRYLFRVSDSKSSGINDNNVIASNTAKHDGLCKDILSLGIREASQMLFGHLDNGIFDDPSFDNLVSWSSSLIFVIQYAIYRSHVNHLPWANTKICVVDTREFPQGQFARDKWLLQAYRNADLSKDQQNFLRLRLGRPEYDNGEYLSQGTLNHSGRSCVFSLRDLEEAGLFDIYPQFVDPLARGQWTKRVRDLRRSWSSKGVSPLQDLPAALSIAKKCFGSFDLWDVICVLLSFRQCEFGTAGLPDIPTGPELSEPAEVCRYMKMIFRTGYYDQNAGSLSGNVLRECFLEKLCDLTDNK